MAVRDAITELKTAVRTACTANTAGVLRTALSTMSAAATALTEKSTRIRVRVRLH